MAAALAPLTLISVCDSPFLRRTDPGATETIMRDGPKGTPGNEERLPLGQRLFDNWALLMLAGILIMAIIYTGWGLLEVLTMPTAELP